MKHLRLALTALLFSLCTLGATAGTKPNIILIYSDCVGIGAVGCTGGPFQTPHIDSLAKGGMLFPSVLTGFIFTAGVSAQTPVSLLDGKLTFVLPGK